MLTAIEIDFVYNFVDRMKILSLNIWGGREYSQLINYLGKLSGDVDVFCFQEVFDTKDHVLYSHDVRANIWEELSKIFLDYHKFYYPVMAGFDDKGPVDFNLTTGLGIFAKRSLEIVDEGDYFTYRRRFAPILLDEKDQPNNVQYVEIVLGAKRLQVYNFHGAWFPGDKLDTPERIEQSEVLLGFMSRKFGAKVLCGDFNLMPETESVKLIEEKLVNLIRSFKIRTTRSHLNPYRGTEFEQAFADYVFVSNDLNVIDFNVPEANISDHLPMILEFEA